MLPVSANRYVNRYVDLCIWPSYCCRTFFNLVILFQEIEGLQGKFLLSKISTKNPNKFIRRYAEMKYGREYVEKHVFDSEQSCRTERVMAEAFVVEDLKSKLTYIAPN